MRLFCLQLEASWSSVPWCFDFPWHFLANEIPWCFECFRLLFCFSRVLLGLRGVKNPWRLGGFPLFLPKHQGMEDQGILLAVELFYLQLTLLACLLTVGAFFYYNFSFFTYNWSFFTYSGKVRPMRALRDCKQRSLTVSKKAPTISLKTSHSIDPHPPSAANTLLGVQRCIKEGGRVYIVPAPGVGAQTIIAAEIIT